MERKNRRLENWQRKVGKLTGFREKIRRNLTFIVERGLHNSGGKLKERI